MEDREGSSRDGEVVVAGDPQVGIERFRLDAVVDVALENVGVEYIGATRGVETMDKVIAGISPEKNLTVIADLCEVMTDGSLCAMGGLTPMPVMSAITHFPEDFSRAGDLPVAAE